MRPSISVVSSVYYSAGYLQEFYDRMTATLNKVCDAYEIIFVLDGSPDDSEVILRRLAQHDPRVRVLFLSRNFGHFKAAFAGLGAARGELVYLTDCDLEEPPELLELFLNAMKTTQPPPDLVMGHQIRRARRGLYGVFASLFYKILNTVGGVSVRQDGIFTRLITQQFKEAVMRYSSEESPLLGGLYQLVGFRQISLPVEKTYKGSSSYSLWRKLSLVTDAVTSFSAKPLVFISLLGLTLTIPALCFSLYIIVRKLFFADYLAGWASVVASIWLMGGLNLMFLGIVGIYVGKTFAQVKQRPNFLIRESLNEGLPLAAGRPAHVAP